MTASGGKAKFRRQKQLQNAPKYLISVTFFGISTETIVVQLINMRVGITVMRGGTLKLVKIQLENAFFPMLSMPSWRRIGVRREAANAKSWILLSEIGMLIFVIDWSHQLKAQSPISTRPSHSSTSANFLRPSNAPAGIDVTEGSTRTRTTSGGALSPPSPV